MPTIKAQAVMANSIAVTLIMYHNVTAKSEGCGVPFQFIHIPRGVIPNVGVQPMKGPRAHHLTTLPPHSRSLQLALSKCRRSRNALNGSRW